MNSALARSLVPSCDVCAGYQQDFEAFLEKAMGLADRAPHPLMLDAALYAFEEGVTASDFALQLMAGA